MSRPSYEARVLVFALGSGVYETLRSVESEAVRVVDVAGPAGAPVEIGGADIVVLAAAEDEPVADGSVLSLGRTARAAGCLVAGICLTGAGGAIAGRHRLVRSLRESADMLLLVYSPDLVADFVDAVRGGAYRS